MSPGSMIIFHRPYRLCGWFDGRHGENQRRSDENRGGHHRYLRPTNGAEREKITELLEAETWMLADKASSLVLPLSETPEKQKAR